MSSENYVNYYVELMTATMQDAILRNISLQANAKMVEETFQNISKENEELKVKLSKAEEDLRFKPNLKSL